MKLKSAFDDYWKALDGAGPKLIEIILERAAHDLDLGILELKKLVDKAYPENW